MRFSKSSIKTVVFTAFVAVVCINLHSALIAKTDAQTATSDEDGVIILSGWAGNADIYRDTAPSEGLDDLGDRTPVASGVARGWTDTDTTDGTR